MVNVAIVGLGRQGMLHLMNCMNIPGVKVVAAADASKKYIQKAKQLGIENVYSDYNDLFNHTSKIDAAVLSLPNFLHFDSIKLALENGINVFAEKPLARTTQECNEIIRLTEKSGKKLMVGHVMRFVDAIETMKKKLDEGLIGNLEVATIEEIVNGPFAHPRNPAPVSDWWFDPSKSGGGCLLDIGYHMIDLYHYFAGESDVDYTHLDHHFHLPVDDGATVLLHSSNSSSRGIVNVGWYQQTVFPKYNFRVLLHGSAGYLSSDDFSPRSLYSYAAKEALKNVARRISGRKVHYLSYTYFYESFYRELEHFVDCIKNDTVPSVTAEDGLRAVKTIEKAYENYRKNELRSCN